MTEQGTLPIPSELCTEWLKAKILDFVTLRQGNGQYLGNLCSTICATHSLWIEAIIFYHSAQYNRIKNNKIPGIYYCTIFLLTETKSQNNKIL